MRRLLSSINAKIAFVIVMILIFALQLIGANFITRTERQLVETFQTDRQIQMDFLENNVLPLLSAAESGRAESDEEDGVTLEEELNELLNSFAGSAITEVYVVDREFVVLGSSDRVRQSYVGQLSNDQDIRQAIIKGANSSKQIVDGGTGARRWRMIEPVEDGEDSKKILGAIIMESNIEAVYNQISDITWMFLSSSFLAIGLSLVLANILSRALTDPIKEMQEQTRRIAEGDYTGEVMIQGRDELGTLGELINELSTEVETAQTTVDSERRRLDSVLGNMSDGVMATDRLGRITIANNMALSMLDVSRDELSEAEILPVLGLDRQVQWKDLFKQERDFVIKSDSDRGPILIRVSFALIESETGLVTGTVCMMHDVTDQERIEAERKEFVSNVSHELRTPLTSMRSYIEALSDGAWKDKDLAPRFLEVAQSETDRMIRMIQDLLHLSRIDSGRSELNLEVIDLNEMLRRIIQRFDVLLDSEEYKEKDYRLLSHLLTETVFVEIDPDRMTQVIDNVLNNAVKYSPDGGTITVKMELLTSQVVISVRDEGMGIPPEDLNKIFTRFYRVDRARSRAMGGTGLGLAISQEVVAQHGGQIWARSREGEGTTFYIALPYIPFEEEEWP